MAADIKGRASPFTGWRGFLLSDGSAPSYYPRMTELQTNQKRAWWTAVLIVVVLFVGLFVGYRLGADGARADNAAERATESTAG